MQNKSKKEYYKQYNPTAAVSNNIEKMNTWNKLKGTIY